jgi:hypothetical protein
MSSVALRYPRMLNRSRGLGCVLALLAAAVMAGNLAAAETAVIAAGRYSRGACQLRLLSAEQERSAQNKNEFNVALQFQLEFPQGAKQQFSAQLPAGIFLNNARSPLTSAEVEPGKNLARGTHNGTAEGGTGVVTIDELEIGPRRDRLRNVEIELALVRVTDWEQKKFENIGLGVTEFLQCGPFEFRVMSDPQQVRLSVWAYPQFRADHDAYHKRVPLKFIAPDYALDQLKLTDRASRSPTATGIAGGGAGASVATFTNWRTADGGTGGVENEEVSYPVTLSLQLPARYDTELVRFHFDQIPLPPPK